MKIVQNLHMSLYLVAELDELIQEEVVYIPKIFSLLDVYHLIHEKDGTTYHWQLLVVIK
jgi:hypothetical protein